MTMLRLAVFPLLLAATFVQAAPLTFGVVLGQDEAMTDSNTTKRYRGLEGDIERALGQPVTLHYYTRGFSAIKDAKSGKVDLMFGPPQVIANISKFKFEPILKSSAVTAVSFVAASAYKGDLTTKSGARLGVPDYESLMGGMARGEINSRGLSRDDFSEIKFHRMPEAPLYGLKLGRYDLAVASADEAKTWSAANGGRIVFTSAPVPLRALSVKTETVPPAAQQKLETALKNSNSLNMVLVAATTADFKGVASMLNTTPTSLPGAKVIAVAEAKELISKGVPVFDVRIADEFEAAHIPGALSVPYKEASAKEVGFDPADDQFALNKLPKDKNTPFIMYCDGTICWKSYKSALMAIQGGWKNVYWFRGGFPEWRDAGLQTVAKKE
jgi:rhodanese-related sulfurtransferase/ABC-type phosphate/phosphonate transport system substrate-binding protein